MRKNPSYTALLGPTRLLISEKSATYTIKWSYTIIWQVRVPIGRDFFQDNMNKRKKSEDEGNNASFSVNSKVSFFFERFFFIHFFECEGYFQPAGQGLYTLIVPL